MKPDKKRLFTIVYKKVFRVLLIILIGAPFIFIFTFLLKSDYFLIKNITVRGAGQYVPEQEVKNILFPKYIHKNIFTEPVTDTPNLLGEMFKAAEYFKVGKKLPDTLEITVFERVPVAVVLDSGGEKYLIDKDGYVMGPAKEGFSDYPQINYESKALVGTFIEKNIVPISREIISVAGQEKVLVSSISFQKDFVRLHVSTATSTGATQALFKITENPAEIINKLSVIIKNSVIDGKNPTKVDLRFDKVIVSYD